MPYKISKVKGGYKVCKRYGKKKCFSKKPLSKARAKAQLRAIGYYSHNESINLKRILSEALESAL